MKSAPPGFVNVLYILNSVMNLKVERSKNLATVHTNFVDGAKKFEKHDQAR